MNNVNVVYVPNKASKEDIEHGIGSIFLAGPTPRDKKIKSWRPDFVKALIKKRAKCTVFVPETNTGNWHGDYIAQCEWEYEHLHTASAVVFWVPRDLETLPGFTTNVEFGYWVKTDRIFYGRPNDAPKTKYLDWLYSKEHKANPDSSIEELVDNVLKWMTG